MPKKRFKTAYLELTNVCNRHCSFCKGTVRPRGFMDPDLFAKAAEECTSLVEKACLHILGEALLHPDLKTIAAHAHRVSLPLVLTTNGTLFGTENAQLLFSAPFRQLNVSLHSGVSSGELDEILAFAETVQRTNPELYLNLRLWDVCAQNPEYWLMLLHLPKPDSSLTTPVSLRYSSSALRAPGLRRHGSPPPHAPPRSSALR